MGGRTRAWYEVARGSKTARQWQGQSAMRPRPSPGRLWEELTLDAVGCRGGGGEAARLSGRELGADGGNTAAGPLPVRSRLVSPLITMWRPGDPAILAARGGTGRSGDVGLGGRRRWRRRAAAVGRRSARPGAGHRAARRPEPWPNAPGGAPRAPGGDWGLPVSLPRAARLAWAGRRGRSQRAEEERAGSRNSGQGRRRRPLGAAQRSGAAART